MSNTAPEKIWVCPLGVHENEVDWTEGNWTDQPEFCGSETEYVRADLLATARADARRVKPLVWDCYDAWTWWAETVVGKYRVEERGKQWAWTQNEGDTYTHGENAESEAQAKAAAQADYERRILSALTDQEGAE